MTEVLWPLDLIPSSQTWSIIGNAATFTSPLSGATRTYGRPGARLGCTMAFPPMKGQDRARLLAFINTLLDRSNRVWVPDFSTTRRGSFPAPELLTNNDFASGTTGWTAHSGFAMTAADRVARLTRLRSSNTADVISVASALTGLTQYATYVARSFDLAGLGSFTSGVQLGSTQGEDNYGRTTSSGGGLKVLGAVIPATSAYFGLVDYQAVPNLAGEYYSCSYTSLSRCALVDGGGNSLTYSDQIDHANWTKVRVSVTANAHTAPDGTTTADRIVEDSNNGTHFFSQTITRVSAAEDWCIYGDFARSGGSRNVLLQIASDTTPTNYAYAYFNLGTGAVMGTGVNGTATNARAFIVPMGNTWFRCFVVGRLAATTTVYAKFGMADSTPAETYTGDGTSGLMAWRCGVVRSSVPSRPTQSTSAAVSAGSQTGTGIYVKGLPASTQGLLEAGDPVQIGGQINFLTARLDSDAAGLGYLQCGRPWLAATNDAPVIVNTPMCKMILATDTIDLDTGPGQFSPFQIELVEAIE